MYLHGKGGFKKDVDKAIILYKEAANLGHAES